MNTWIIFTGPNNSPNPSLKASLEVVKFCFPAMVLIAFEIAFFVIPKLILSHFSL